MIVAINPSSTTPPAAPGEYTDEGRHQRRERQAEKWQRAEVRRSEKFHEAGSMSMAGPG
ncbi:MAG: hypothetical protein ACREDY_06660 [Bradyrhizobium sp.]